MGAQDVTGAFKAALVIIGDDYPDALITLKFRLRVELGMDLSGLVSDLREI